MDVSSLPVDFSDSNRFLGKPKTQYIFLTHHRKSVKEDVFGNVVALTYPIRVTNV